MGHVFSVDFPAEYNNWQAVEPQKLFEAPVLKSESNPKQHIVKHLQVESKGVDYLVLFLDADREGENICFEVIKVTQPHMKSPENGKSKRTHVFRARFSCM
jgi:DNA topoisomerase-3